MLHDLSCTKTSQSYTLIHTYGEKNLISDGGIVKGAWGLDLQSDFKILSQISRHSWHLQRGWIHKGDLGSAFQQLAPTRTHGTVPRALLEQSWRSTMRKNSWMRSGWEESEHHPLPSALSITHQQAHGWKQVTEPSAINIQAIPPCREFCAFPPGKSTKTTKNFNLQKNF